MGQKTNPIGFRLSVRRNWESRWYAGKKELPVLVQEDYRIREHLMGKLRYASVPRIFIERFANRVRIKIFTARPGVVIGQKGRQLEQIKADLAKLTGKDVLLDIHEVKKPDVVAYVVAEQIALQLERRISFRRAMKKAVQSALALGAQGIRIRCAGRLGGAEIARVETVRQGRVPLHTLRANIDYGFAEANTVAGKIGIKVWIGKKDDETL